MSWRHRAVVMALIAAALITGGALTAFAATACPVDTPEQACPDYARNRAVVVLLAASTAALAVAPFAFLGDFVMKRRIVYRDAWWRAAMRGALVGLVVAVFAGLRLGGVLSMPVAIFVLILALLVDRVMISRKPIRRSE